MVFGFFGSKKQPLAPPETVPLPPSPSPSAAQLAPSKNVVQEQTQLRTPSPSIASGSATHGAPQTPSPAARMARLSVEEKVRQVSPTRQSTSIMSAPTFNTPFIPPQATVESLTSHLNSIPAKALHTYVLHQIPRAPEPVLSTLAEFFSELAPPLRLHCVRCHKDYAEIENDDRSCLVAHDDDSAEVERVGRGAKSGRPAGDPGTTYETLWGCCGKITEGDGDQGPPDGWCYEGKHTTDIKRARFRTDSTPQDDKLTSCLRLNCHGIRDQLPRASLRKRPRDMNLRESDTDEDASEGEADSGVDEIMGGSRVKDKGKGKAKAKDVQDKPMDIDQEPESASRAGSVRGRAQVRGRTKSNANVPSATSQKRRGRPSKAKPAAQETTDAEDVDDNASVKSAPTGKRRGRKPKSKAYISDSDMDQDQDAGERKTGPRTRSQSRTRVSTSTTQKPKSRVKKARVSDENDANVSGRDEDQPKKRRKISA